MLSPVPTEVDATTPKYGVTKAYCLMVVLLDTAALEETSEVDPDE